MKTVPNAVNPPGLPLATAGQTIQGAKGTNRLVMRAVMPGAQLETQPATQAQDASELRGKVLDQET